MLPLINGLQTLKTDLGLVKGLPHFLLPSAFTITCGLNLWPTCSRPMKHPWPEAQRLLFRALAVPSGLNLWPTCSRPMKHPWPEAQRLLFQALAVLSGSGDLQCCYTLQGYNDRLSRIYTNGKPH